MEILTLIYATTCGFGVSFLVIQFMFAAGDEIAGDEDVDGVGDGDHGIESGSDVDHDLDMDIDHDVDTDTDNGDHGQMGRALHTDDLERVSVHPTGAGGAFLTFLSFLRITRKLTYFCAGFGTMGLICVLMGSPYIISLAYAIGVGAVSVALTSYLFKWINPVGAKLNDSRIQLDQLIGCFGEVLTPVGPGDEAVGEVKIVLNDQMKNVYAIAKGSQTSFKKGDTVTIYKFTEKGIALVEASEITSPTN